PIWFRLSNRIDRGYWLAKDESSLAKRLTSPQEHLAEMPQESRHLTVNFMPGRFGRALTVLPGHEFRIADHLIKDGQQVRLFDERQGTIEFWIRRQWDDRLTRLPPKWPQISNGLLQIAIPWKLPLDEWAHVAVVWRPFKHDPERTCVHYYVNGLDEANYRNVKWA